MLYLVHTPIGNLQDVSTRMRDTLKEAELILCEDTRTARRLLTALKIPHKRLLSFYEHNEEERIPMVLKKLREGKNIALIAEAGAPLLQDPGFPLVSRVVREGLPFTVIPGPSAVIQALLLSGLPPYPFAFFGFLSPRAHVRHREIERISRWEHTAVLFLSPHRLPTELHHLSQALGTRPCALVREMTKLHEEVLRLPRLSEYPHYLPRSVRGEWTLVIGPCLPDSTQEPAHATKEIPLELLTSAAERVASGGSAREIAHRLSGELGLPFRKIYRQLLWVIQDRKRTQRRGGRELL